LPLLPGAHDLALLHCGRNIHLRITLAVIAGKRQSKACLQRLCPLAKAVGDPKRTKADAKSHKEHEEEIQTKQQNHAK